LLGFKGSIIKNFDFNDFEITGLFGAATFTHWQPRGTITAGLKDGDNYAVVNGVQSNLVTEPNTATNYIDQNFGYVTPYNRLATVRGLRLEVDWAVVATQGYFLEGDVFMLLKVGDKSVKMETVGGQPVGKWTTGTHYIKRGRAAGKSGENMEFIKFELDIDPQIGVGGWSDIRLFAPVNGEAIPPNSVTGSAWSRIVLKPVETDGSEIDQDAEILTEVNNQSNYEPTDIDVAIGDVPDAAFADLIYSNVLGYQYSGNTQKWKYTTADGLVIEDTLLLVLAGQIEQLFKVNRLMLQANITSDILRFNSLLTDTARLGTRVFMMMRASFDAKRLAWQNVELIEIGGTEAIPDFDKPDYEDFDFFTE
jgi:hypothetical protein